MGTHRSYSSQPASLTCCLQTNNCIPVVKLVNNLCQLKNGLSAITTVTGRFGPIPIRTPGRFGPIPFRSGPFGPILVGRFGPIHFI